MSPRRIAPGLLTAATLAVVAYFGAKLPGLKVTGPLTLALILGLALRAAWTPPVRFADGTRFAARTVLRAGIVLLGARLDFAVVASVGPRILLLDAIVLTAACFGVAWLCRAFGVPRKLAIILGVATGVCGASAAVAAGAVTRADEEDVTLAVALAGLLGTTGVFLYVLAGPHLGLTESQLAVLIGATLHEVAQVTAAAFAFGTTSGDVGTLVKLIRVVLLAPTLVVLGLLSHEGGRFRFSWKDPPVPWFVVGFLAVGAVRSTGVLAPDVVKALSATSVFLMVVAMAAMGLNTPLQMLRRAGPRAVGGGLLGFLLLAAFARALIPLLGIS